MFYITRSRTRLPTFVVAMLASTHCHWPQPVFRIRCTFFRYHRLLILAIPAGNVILNWPKLLRHFKNGFYYLF